MKLIIAALLASSAAAFTTSPAARVSSDVLVLERYGVYVYHHAWKRNTDLPCQRIVRQDVERLLFG